MAKEALEKNKGKLVYSLGPIIHNNQVVEELFKEGLKSVKGLNEVKKGVVVISSHGASPKVIEQIKNKGFEIVNAACPYVLSAQKIAKSLNDDGYCVVIVGDRHHPEVEALVGFAGGEAIVIKDAEELKKVKFPSGRVGIISQTTQSLENYFKIIYQLLKMPFSEVRIFNTICTDTEKRQKAAAKLAKEADAMIIVGGKMSANTKRLFEICSGICGGTYHIETAKELKKDWIKGKGLIGIASGASTPDWIIEDVKNKI